MLDQLKKYLLHKNNLKKNTAIPHSTRLTRGDQVPDWAACRVADYVADCLSGTLAR
jgi:hypothetical protein